MNATLTAQDAWLAALGSIQMQVSPATYNLYFRDTKCIGYRDGVLTIQARMQTFADELTAKYLEMCQKIVQKVWRQEVAIEFTAQPSSVPIAPPVAIHNAPDWEALYREAQQENTALRQENTALKREVAYLSEWGGGVALPASQVTTEGVFIPRAVLNQVVDLLLNGENVPRSAASMFLYVLSHMDENGIAKLEATDISQNVLKMKNRRSWANLLGPIFGSVVNKDGRNLRINVTPTGYNETESNLHRLQLPDQPETESNLHRLQDEKLSPPQVTLTEIVTPTGYIPPVIMNGDDINKKSSDIDIHQSSLPPDTAKRLEGRKRQLHALQFAPKMAERYLHTITYAPDDVWDGWIEQAERGKNPAALMCNKIKSQAERYERKVIDLRRPKKVG